MSEPRQFKLVLVNPEDVTTLTFTNYNEAVKEGKAQLDSGEYTSMQLYDLHSSDAFPCYAEDRYAHYYKR